MSNESEVIFHRGDRNDSTSAKVRHHDDDNFWVVESYDSRTTRAMAAAGAEEIPSHVDGQLFKASVKQLIMGLAEEAGLVVEFRPRKRRQDSEATKARLAARMQEVRQHQKA